MLNRSYHVGTAVALTLLAFLLAGCVTHTGGSSLETRPNESLVAGRFRVTYNGSDVTERVYFNLKNRSGKVFRIDQEEDGFFLARLPVGSYELSNIILSKVWVGFFGYDLEPGRLVLDVPVGGTIYDAGLVSIDWAGPGVKMGAYFGLVGAIVDVSRGNGQLAIRLLDDSPNLQSEVVRRFGRHPPMVKTSLRTAAPSMGPPSGTELTPASSTRPVLAPSPVTAEPVSSRLPFSGGAPPLESRPAPPAAQPSGHSARLSAQVDELLRDLDRKRESGMISEAEYTSRRRELEDYAAELERRRPVGD